MLFPHVPIREARTRGGTPIRAPRAAQATPRRLEEAWKKGQFARSAEVQTVLVLFGGVLALLFVYVLKAPVRRQFSQIVDRAESAECEPSPPPLRS